MLPSPLLATTNAAAILLSLILCSGVSALSRPQPHQPQAKAIIPPPPPISMPVWSLSCPMIPSPSPTFASPSQASAKSSMSILTFLTPVSVSSPKLWAISLYKTSLTRCAFLGVPNRGEEYNDISSISSSATATPGTARSVRRRGYMGEAGLLPGGVDGAVGWRVTGEYRRQGSRPLGTTKGVGILQLLSPKQSNLVPILGKTPGWDGGAVMKREECAKLGHEWVEVVGLDEEERFEVLPSCASYLQIKLKRVTDGGDHDVCIVQVTNTGVWDNVNKTVLWLEEGDQQPALDAATVLYSGQLRDEGII